MPEKEIVSAQVVFPDGRTLDEVYADMLEEIEKLTTKVASLEAAAAQEEST